MGYSKRYCFGNKFWTAKKDRSVSGTFFCRAYNERLLHSLVHRPNAEWLCRISCLSDDSLTYVPFFLKPKLQSRLVRVGIVAVIKNSKQGSDCCCSSVTVHGSNTARLRVNTYFCQNIPPGSLETPAPWCKYRPTLPDPPK